MPRSAAQNKCDGEQPWACDRQEDSIVARHLRFPPVACGSRRAYSRLALAQDTIACEDVLWAESEQPVRIILGPLVRRVSFRRVETQDDNEACGCAGLGLVVDLRVQCVSRDGRPLNGAVCIPPAASSPSGAFPRDKLVAAAPRGAAPIGSRKLDIQFARDGPQQQLA